MLVIDCERERTGLEIRKVFTAMRNAHKPGQCGSVGCALAAHRKVPSRGPGPRVGLLPVGGVRGWLIDVSTLTSMILAFPLLSSP